MKPLRTLHAFGCYFNEDIALHVMDDFGNLVPLGFTAGSPLTQWQYSIGPNTDY